MTLLEFVVAHPLVALTALAIVCITLVRVIGILALSRRLPPRPEYVPGRTPPPPPRPPSPQKDWSDGETAHHRTHYGAGGG